MEHGLIIGKFYPPHDGHHFLIDTALAECQQVTVLILVNDVEAPSMPGMIRVNMIEHAHHQAHVEGRLKVYHVVDNEPVDYNSRKADMAHAKIIHQAIMDKVEGYFPNKLYTSETYGDNLTSDLNTLFGSECITHRLVDLKRIAKPISATRIRADVLGNWEHLAPSTRAIMTRRIVICGGESTGTTTLAKALAERYQTVWVPEYGRTFSEAVGNHHVWTSADFAHIMEEQNYLEDSLARFAGPVLFCDTDNLATRMFHELYMGSEGPDTRLYHEVERYMSRTLYIITDDVGVPFEDDGYRLYPHQRKWATKWFEHNLDNLSLPYIKVGGSHNRRMDLTTEKIDTLLTWDFATPVEYQ